MKFKNDKQRKAVMANLNYGRTTHAIRIDKALQAKKQFTNKSGYAASNRSRSDLVGYDDARNKNKEMKGVLLKHKAKSKTISMLDDIEKFDKDRKSIADEQKKQLKTDDDVDTESWELAKKYKEDVEKPSSDVTHYNMKNRDKIEFNEEVKKGMVLNSSNVVAKIINEDDLSVFNQFVTTDTDSQVVSKEEVLSDINYGKYQRNIKNNLLIDNGISTHGKKKKLPTPESVVFTTNNGIKGNYSIDYLNSILNVAGRNSKIYLKSVDSPLYIKGADGKGYILAPRVGND